MNEFKEGMRRTGLVLGAIGFGCGCLFSRPHLVDLRHERDAALQFRSLLSSSDVQTAITAIKRRNQFEYLEKASNLRGVIFWDGKEEPTDSDIKAIRAHGYPIKAHDVRSVHFDDDGDAVAFLENRTGTLVSNATAPPLDQYLLLGVPPVIGFLVVWGALKCIVWVYSGFSRSG